MRTILNGVLTVGRLAIPVGLATTRSGAGSLDLVTLHRECGTPVERRPYCPFHESLVEPLDDDTTVDDQLIKAWEPAKGQYVPLESDDLAAIAPAESTTIRIDAFVAFGEIDPLLVQRAYYLAPSPQLALQRAYALLAAALDENSAVGVGRFVAWGTEHPFAVKTLGDEERTLVLQTLAFPEDLIPADPIQDVLRDARLLVEDRELDLAGKLIQRLTVPLEKADLTPHARNRRRELLERKLAGEPIVTSDAAAALEEPELRVDLAAVLAESIREAPRRRARTRTS